ncbi:DUF4367 domain-containing protein [Methanolobus sp. ZRKC2]|uniref:DUF4367 domain-containing protein n=1 Tax=Methanolobus sp. ZRKC2 TaxID=3125783 RepID=UPI0032549350
MCIALFNSGCIGEDLTADQIAEKMQEKQENIEDTSATVHMKTSMGDEVQVMEYETIQKNPNKMKSVVILPEELAGQTTVTNGEKMWTYDPNTNQVTIMEMPEIPEDFEIDYATVIGSLLNESDVSLMGIEDFNGRNTYVIKLSSKENESLFGSNMTVWVDEETWTPLKIEMGTKETYQIVVEYRNFEVNTGISDDEFEFDIPEGAEIIDVGDFDNLLPVDMTFEEAQEISAFQIRLPSHIPEGYEQDKVLFSNNSLVASLKGSFTLIYSNGENKIAISENFYEGEKDSSQFSLLESEKISVNGVEADLYTTYGDTRVLQWEIEDAVISISGSLDTNEIIRIAESMK